MAAKTDIATQQIFKTIQNKIPLNKGIVRKSLEVDKGYVSALHNFEIKNGETLTVRPGTRVMNSMQDQQFYFVESFRMSNMNITIGLNYKRELWAWLEKWPETDFKVCNTSPFKKYTHKDVDGGTYYSPHFSFTKGNKFFVGEDDFSIIIINDYGEIFRIMKVGSIRITTDADVLDQATSIEDARDAYLFTGRIWLDIKEATNRVFENKMFLGDEYIRNSHRITGETRFAYVNELSVISELSDPINIEGYRHIVASHFPVVPFDPRNKEVTLERIVRYGGTKQSYSKIYESTTTGWAEATLTASNTWEPALPSSNVQEASSYILAVKSGYYEVGGVQTEISEGVYLSTCMRTADTTCVPIAYTAGSVYNYNAIKLDSVDLSSNVNSALRRVFNSRMFIPSNFRALPSIPGLVKILSASDDFQSYTGASSFDDLQVSFDGTKIGFSSVSGSYYKGYVRLDESFDESAFTSKEISIDNGTHKISFIGQLLEVKHYILSDPSPSGVYWNKDDIRAIESKSSLFEKVWTFWKNKGYDCWDYNGVASNVSPSEIDLNKQVAIYDEIPEDTDVILASEDLSSVTASIGIESRFALWNDSHVMGISQRFFRENMAVYEGIQQDDAGNMNVAPSTAYTIGYSPLMTLDYTGLRKIPMTLPLIRRAMRNPQFVVVAGSNIYSVEDNKIWVGSVSDCMMIDEIELHSAIYDVKAFGSGMIASTKNGLFLVERGSDVRRVVDGDSVIPRFMAICSGGVLVVEDNNIYVVHRKVTSTGDWYPTLTQINDQIIEANLEGKLKSVSIGDIIYLADEYTVWLYDVKKGIWCGQYVYGENGEKIQDLFVFNSKLGVIFETGINREKSFDSPSSDIR